MLSKRVLFISEAVILAMTFLVALGWMLAGAETHALTTAETATSTWLNASVAAPPTNEVCFVSLNDSGTTDYLSSDGFAIQEAVNAAIDGDLLRVAGWCDSTFVTNGLTQTVYISKSLTIQGGYDEQNWGVGSDPDTNPTTLVAWDSGRVIVIDGTDLHVTLDGLTVRRGNANDGTLADNGGGIWSNGYLTLTTIILNENHANEDGGAIYNDGGNLNIYNSYFEANSSDIHGGGVYNLAGQANIDTTTFYANTSAGTGGAYASWLGNDTIKNSTFITNTSTNIGGALRSGSGVMTVSHSIIQGNGSGTFGGGVYANASTQLTLTDTIIHDNYAYQSGGGVYAIGGVELNIQASAIVSNSAQTERGGGIYINNDVTAIIQNSTVSGNQAAGENGTINDGGNGGGLYVGGPQGSQVTIKQSTISHNYAAGEGGGMDFNRFAPGDILTFENTILAGNTAGGTHQNCYDYNTVNYTFNSDAYNLFSGVVGDDCPLGATDLSLTALGQTIDDVLLPLANNGGDTLTHALLPASVVIDAGNPAYPTQADDFDQRGTGFPRVSNGRIDIGALEQATCFVESNGDNVTDYSSVDASALQTAVDNAAANDFIKIAGTCAGTQTTNGQDRTVYISQTLTLEGGHTPTDWSLPPDTATYETILDAEENSGVVYIDGNNTVTMTHLTIQNGQKPGGSGAGIYNNKATLYLSHSNILSNTLTNRSGGLYNEGGHATINHTFFANNSGRWGGGVASLSATTLIQDSTFLQNHATDHGGAVHNQTSTVIITNTTFTQNQADGNGGAIANGYFVETSIVDSVISDNVAYYSGGGIYSNDSKVNVSNTAIVDNIAQNSRGGGIYFIENSEATLTNVTISGNQALGLSGTANDDGNGGGIYVGAPNEPNTISVTHSTITQNYAAGEGGGMDFNRFMPGDTLTFVGTILAGNSAGGTHQDCYDYDTDNYTFNSNAYNLFSGAVGDDCQIGTSDLSLTALGLEIEDVLDTTVADNGGGTPTHALLPNSAAVGQIPLVTNGCGTQYTADQRGVLRPQDGECDIGAYELWQLHIGITSPTELDLTWGDAAASCVYNVYEETIPYFIPSTVTYPDQSSGVVYPRLGDVVTNYFYVIEAVCGGVATAVSNQVGEFDYPIVPGS